MNVVYMLILDHTSNIFTRKQINVKDFLRTISRALNFLLLFKNNRPVKYEKWFDPLYVHLPFSFGLMRQFLRLFNFGYLQVTFLLLRQHET